MPDLLAAPMPGCPRCGYDLTGQVAAWTDSCPLEGLCTECGLLVRWATVLGRAGAPPRWSAEHCRLLAVPWRTLSTGLRALRPRRFWSAVRLHHPVRMHRLMVIVLVATIAAWLLPFVAGLMSRYTYYPRVAPQFRYMYSFTVQSLTAIALDPVTGEIGWSDQPPWIGDPVLAGGAACTSGFGIALLIARSSRRSRIRLAHIARALAWSLAPLGLYLLIRGVDANRWSLLDLFEPAPAWGVGPTPGPIYMFFAQYTLLEDFLWGSRRGWTVLAACVWLALYWWSALRVGFEIESPRQVFAAGAVLATLLALAGVAFADIWLLGFL